MSDTKTVNLDLGGYETISHAKVAAKVRHNEDCTADCHMRTAGWYVAEHDGRFYVAFTHDTYSGDGFGAWFQTLEDFGTRSKAEAFLAAVLA